MLRDPQLLAAYRQGQSQAFLQIYNRYAAPLKRFLQGGFSFSSQGRLCRFKGVDSGMDVDGLVQETFARIFIKTTRENYDGIRPFQTYLFSIAINLVLRECHYRDRVIHVDYIQEADSSQAVFASRRNTKHIDSPESCLAAKQLQAISREFLTTLNDEEKRFFSIRFARGLTQEKTAEKMDTTRARIKLIEKNVRKRFLEKLRRHGYFVDYTPNPRWRRKPAAKAKAV